MIDVISLTDLFLAFAEGAHGEPLSSKTWHGTSYARPAALQMTPWVLSDEYPKLHHCSDASNYGHFDPCGPCLRAISKLRSSEADISCIHEHLVMPSSFIYLRLSVRVARRFRDLPTFALLVCSHIRTNMQAIGKYTSAHDLHVQHQRMTCMYSICVMALTPAG